MVRTLSMPRVDLLIADDVGLGKTIEAGLMVQETILRHRVRSVLIVCPSSFQLPFAATIGAVGRLRAYGRSRSKAEIDDKP